MLPDEQEPISSALNAFITKLKMRNKLIKTVDTSERG